MDTFSGPLDAQPTRMQQLETDFAQLAPQIPDGAEKRALSLLHGMVQELWRSAGAAVPAGSRPGPTIEDIIDLHQHAPAMEGKALNDPLNVGTKAPDFTLPDANGRPISLSDYRGKPVVLVFYPLDWSPGCSRQLDLYQQELDAFRDRNTELIGLSVDSIYSHGAWAAVRGITFPLLADFHPKGEVARRYNVWREPDGFSERALYLVNADGIIRYAHVSPQLHHVPDIYELFEVIDGLKKPVAA